LISALSLASNSGMVSFSNLMTASSSVRSRALAVMPTILTSVGVGPFLTLATICLMTELRPASSRSPQPRSLSCRNPRQPATWTPSTLSLRATLTAFSNFSAYLSASIELRAPSAMIL
jgi:hypothetical protein